MVVVGVGTLILARVDARQRTRAELTQRVADAADTVAALPDGSEVAVLSRLRRVLRLDDLALIRVGPLGRTIDPVPTGVPLADLDLDALRSGAVVSGVRNGSAFAATVVPDHTGDRILPVVVAAEGVDVGVGHAGRWFVLAAGVTILLGAGVAWSLGRRLAGPLADAEAATRRIAAGDLGARVPEPKRRRRDDDELGRLVRSINEMAGELERSRSLEQQFLLSVSHDLRTPLTSIRGWAEAIADGAAADPASAAEVVLSEARRLERLVRDLLDLARLQSRQFTFDIADVDLADVAAGTAEGLRPDLEDGGVAIDVAGPAAGAPVVVRADPDRLAQVAANLIENAGKYAASRVRVSVSMTTSNGSGWAVLSVDDDGPGIAAEDLPHVFERLYVSPHRPPRAESGSGLGLAIVRELVVAMGGTVGAGAGPDGGARLSVHLPTATNPR